MSTHREHVLGGDRLVLQFAWHKDRFAHRITLMDRCSGDVLSLLESVEEGSSEPWPVSPPFQSLHTVSRQGERQVALLVGMAGKSHWSASVEVDAAEECIRFDVACRQHAAVGAALGSQYRAGGMIEVHNSTHAVVVTASQKHGLALHVDERSAPARLVVAGQTIRIEPQSSPPGDQAATIRWGYTVSVFTS